MRDSVWGIFLGILGCFLFVSSCVLVEWMGFLEAQLEIDRAKLELKIDEARWNKAVAYDRLDEYRAMYFEHNLTKNNVLSKP